MRGHITQRGKGTWLIRVELPRDPGTGKRRQKAETIHGTKREAEARLAQMLIDAGQGYHVDAERMTVGQYLDQWQETVKGEVRANTYQSYVYAVRAFKPLIGHIPLGKLTPLDVKQAVKRLESSQLNPGTVKLYLGKIRVALEQAVGWELVPKNQAKKVKSAKYEKPEAGFWTEEEARLFLRSTAKRRYHCLWLLAIRSGMREGELIALKWPDLDLDRGLVHVRRTATPFGENDPKSGAGNRTLPVDPETVGALKKHRKAMMEETLRRGGKWSEHTPVFLTKTGNRLSAKLCRLSLDSAITAAGVKRIVFHGLRHTYATILLRRGVNVNKVAKLLGHANAATTLNTYGHVLPEDDAQVIAAISQAFEG